MENSQELYQTKSVAWRDYLELTKPRVVALMMLTAIVGMCLATATPLPLIKMALATLGISFAAGSAAVINHLADRHIDQRMRRTENRPVATGRVSTRNGLVFAAVLGIIAAWVLINYINTTTAILSFASLLVYAGIYTFYLKHATPQNIVIGGIAGAAPPLLGWVAMTGTIDPQALLLVLIIFIWTPPHFWALAIFREEDYRNADIPMLTNTHGIAYTKLSIVLYSLLLFAVTLLPYAVGMSGWIYLVGVILLNSRFMQWVVKLYKTDNKQVAMFTFRYSIIYLMLLFILLLVDHYYMLLH